ncbi:MAG: DinB family protein [Chloroflexi bacterium]|nr:DinB family protein [Chloroflexota bacterium]
MNRITHLVDRLTQKGDETVAFFNAAAAMQDQPVYPAWCVRDVLAHLVWSERGMRRLYQGIAEGGTGAADDFDIDRYNASKARSYAEIPYADLLEQFGTERAETIAWVRTLDEAVLDRRGRHPAMGEDTLERLIKILYLHTGMHQRDVAASL